MEPGRRRDARRTPSGLTVRALAWVRSLRWNLFRRADVEAALDEELGAYVELLASEYERSGLSKSAAHRRALIDAGGVEQIKESARDAWAGAALATLARELRDAFRSLCRSPGFVTIAVATLGIGIAGATAVFTIVNAELLRPLPGVTDPARLVTLERVQTTATLDDFGYPDFLDYRDQSRALAGLAAYNGTPVSLSDRSGTRKAWVSYVSGDFFSLLGVRPALGRLLGPGDVTSPGADPVVVIGYGLWETRFGGDSSIVGTAIRLNGEMFTIVGVAPRGFIGAMRLHGMNLWIPVTMIQHVAHYAANDILQARGEGWFRLIGRLAPGHTVADAQRDLSTIAARLAATYSTNKGRGVRVLAGAGMTVDERADAARLPMLLSLAVALLMVIACANVAGLSLVRASARSRELATRLALGASRTSLMRRAFVEGAVIAGAAAIVGVLGARLLVRSASIVGTVAQTGDLDLGLDGTVLAMALAMTVLTALLISLVPAARFFRADLAVLMKDGAGGAVRRRSAAQRVLVALQIAASLVLLASSSIVYRAFRRVLATDPGFDGRGLTYVYPDDRAAGYDSTRSRVFYRALLAQAESDRRYDAAALTSTVPPEQWSTRVSVYRAGEEPPAAALDGREFEPGNGVRAYIDAISPTLFGVMHIPIRLGRAFTARDDEHAPPVVIVSRRLADMLWPNANPINRYLAWPVTRADAPARAPLRVVGVAADTRHSGLLNDPPPVMYVPFTQQAEMGQQLALLVHGRGGRTPRPAAAESLVARLDPQLTRFSGTVEEHVESGVAAERTAGVWIGAFGSIALVLAAIGLYGVIAQSVLQRTRELAVRVALGATPRTVVMLVLADGARLAAFGGTMGVFGAIAGVRLLRAEFGAVESFDAAAALVPAVVLAIALLAACCLPARRAVRLNAVDALRTDA